MRVGALETFLQPTAPVVLSDSEYSQEQRTHVSVAAAADGVKQEQVMQQQQQHAAASSPLKRHTADAIDVTSDSPELLPLAARLQAHTSKLGPAGTAAAAGAAAMPAVASAAAAGGTGMAPPAKKASTDRAKELLASPPTPSRQQCQQWKALGSAGAGAAAGQGQLTAQFAALLDEAGVLSPVPQRQHPGASASRPRSAAKELFTARPVNRQQQQQQQQDVIELLDSPADAGGLQHHRLAAGHGCGVDAHKDDDADVVDLT
jgi:hypothetical protein